MAEVRRFPLPWKLHGNDACFWVEDAEGKRFGYCYFLTQARLAHDGDVLSREEALRIARNIVKLPELLHQPNGGFGRHPS